MVLYAVIVVAHVIVVLAAVGAVSITDYLHLISLRRKNLDKQLVKIYPHITKFIFMALGGIYATGIALTIMNPSLLQSPLFITKLILVLIVTINGIILQGKVGPELDKCVLNGTKYCTKKVLYTSAIAGSVSVVTWYAILILALTKNLGYTLPQFIFAYLSILLIATVTATYIEAHARKWR